MEQTELGNRILVLGCPGSGKSTFARRLHDCTGLPLIHLDNIWWREDRSHISRAEFDRQLEALLQGARWILDGNYSRTYETRVRACDTVIFLDYSTEVCMSGLTHRIGQSRPDMPWVEQRLDPELVELVRKYPSDNRPLVYALLERYPEKRALVFQTRAQAKKWLATLAQL